MVRWSKEAREANKAARERLAEQAAQEAFNENVAMNMSTAQKRSVDSPPRQISKSRRSNRKKANTGSTPPSKDNNKESVTESNNRKQDLDASFTSQETTKPIDILRQQHALIIQCLLLRLPSTYTDDGFIHAIAIMLDVKINFIILLNDVKAQLIEDFIFVLSDPEFKRNTLYTRKNLETISMFVNIQPEFPPQLTSRSIKNNVDKLLQEILTKKGAKITTIPNLGWTEMCKLTGVFLSPNSIEPLDKVPLVKKVLSAIRQYKPQLIQWYNKHALSHMSYYFGHEYRPVANNATDYMVPPFYTDATVEAEFRRDGYYKLLELTEGPCPNYSNYKTLSWCASGQLCTVDIFDASTTICSQCAVPVHPQCSSRLKKEYYCFSCHPDRSRHSWYCYTECYIELPLARSTPNHAVNDEDNSQAMSEGGDAEHFEDQVPGSDENEFDDVNDADETNRDMNPENDPEVDEDDASVVRRLNLDGLNATTGTITQNSSPQRDNNSITATETEFPPPDPLTPSYTSYYEHGFYISRIDLSLTLVIATNDTRSDEEKFLDAAKLFLQRLLTIDNKITILPWKEFTNIPPLNIENLDPDFDEIQVYFNRARVLEDNLKVYCDARFKHEMSWDALAITMRNWLQTNNTGMYYKKLQVEQTRVLGWMLWSHRHIKVDKLAHVLANDDNIHLFFRFSKIYLGKGEKFALNEGVKAIFAVCDAKDFEFYSSALKIIYHRSVTHFPLGIKLRFMPQVMNADEDLLITQQKFRAQQEQFLASIVTASSMDIRLLDASVGEKKTLRNVIMNLTHPDGIQMFLSVDTQWNNTARHIFAFTKNHEKNAIRMVNTLPAYLTRLKQQDVLPYFTIEAMEKSSKLQWDEKRQWFMTPDEIYYFEMDIFEGATNFGIEADPTTTEATGTVAERVSTIEAKSTRVERIYAGTDACSIGTVASKAKRNRMTGHMESDSERDNSSIGSTSTANKSSKSEKEKKLERKLEVLTANQSETTRTLADLTVLLNKVLGLHADKTIRVQEPNGTNTVTPASGNPPSTTTFAAGSTPASGAAK